MRAEICGGEELRAAADALGLTPAAGDGAALVLIDLRDPGAVTRAAGLENGLPRIVVVDEAQRELARALGLSDRSIATCCDPAVIGPLIAATMPRTVRRATRSALVTSARGGVGRSLLVANLALRLAPRRSTIALDVTGSGGLAWWLGTEAASWRELEGLTAELAGDHLAVIAAEPLAGLRVVGGAPAAPTVDLAVAALGAALALAEIVLVDAPTLADERTRALIGRADRTLVLSYDDPASLAMLLAADLPSDAWLIGSQTQTVSLAERGVFRALPRDESSVLRASEKRAKAAGALGRAYDELADLLALDAS